jgi:hypothetical protein
MIERSPPVPMSKKVFHMKLKMIKQQAATRNLIEQTERLLHTLRFIGVESFGDSTLTYRYAMTREALAKAKNTIEIGHNEK